MCDRDNRQVIAHQFADEWLMVAMNDSSTYDDLMEKAIGASLSSLADELSDEWERLAQQVAELVEERISPTASLFIGQWLKGQGVLPFDLIAQEVLAKKAEVSK
jgi:hypothetical protein